MSKFLGITPTLGSGSSFGLGSGLPPSGPAPVISLATPNVSSAAGGWNITLTGSNFTGATAVKIAGVSATSIVVVNDTTITCKAPAFSTPNGTSTAQTISVKTSNGTGISTSFYYYPSNTPLSAAYRGDVGTHVSLGIVTQWDDQTSNGNNLTRPASYQGPGQTTVNGLAATTWITGENLGLNVGAAPIGITGSPATICCVGQATSYPSGGGTIAYLNSTGGGNFQMGLSAINISTPSWTLTDAVATNLGLSVGPYNTGQLYSIVGLNNGPTLSARYVNNDDTGATGSQGTIGTIFDFQVGNHLGLANTFDGTICEVLLFNGAVSSADLTTIYQIQKTIWAIP